MKKTFKPYIILILISSTLCCCKKFVTVGPPTTAITGENVYTQDATACAVLNGLYLTMVTNDLTYTGLGSITVSCGLSADELTLISSSADPALSGFYKNALTALQPPNYWGTLYTRLQTVNAALEGLSNANTLTPAVKQQLTGEAKFMRAFYHFYLVNLYGDIPLATSSDYRINARSPRSLVSAVYEQIITDLKDAAALLSENYLNGDAITMSTDRVRPTKWAATALLARAYLYKQDWANAAKQATLVIDHSAEYDLEQDLNNVFLKNSRETIWALMPSNTATFNTQEASTFVLIGGPDEYSKPVYLSNTFLQNIESSDKRLVNWIGIDSTTASRYYYPFKYKSFTAGAPVTEYLMVLRLAEQYLIRAEAKAQQNNISGAQNDLNAIRNRAGLPNTTANNKTTLLQATMHERQIEFFTEWGHRWLDLKRTNSIDAVMEQAAQQKGTTWKTTAKLYPLPVDDIKLNTNLQQNPGY